jgi:hypothetical protein
VPMARNVRHKRCVSTYQQVVREGNVGLCVWETHSRSIHAARGGRCEDILEGAASRDR